MPGIGPADQSSQLSHKSRAASEGALYLTNIQQMYERTDAGSPDEPDPIAALLGPKPVTKKIEVDDFARRVAARGGPCLVVNDEAHQTHDEESEWNKVIRRLHQDVPHGLTAQLDFSATPRFSKGVLFTWTIFEYPLKQAIIDNVVKRPMKGIANIQEQPAPSTSLSASRPLPPQLSS
jgi:type III restriction enzyme